MDCTCKTFLLSLDMIHFYLYSKQGAESEDVRAFVVTRWIVLVRAFVICIYSSGGLDMTDLMFIPRHSFVICLMRERIIHVTPFVVFYCLICIQRRDGLHI